MTSGSSKIANSKISVVKIPKVMSDKGPTELVHHRQHPRVNSGPR
jgi:hypothetical protein